MDLAKKRISASEMYQTPDGDIEYTVQGEESGSPPACAGGGFDFGSGPAGYFLK